MTSQLSADQILYLRDVLGIESVVIPRIVPGERTVAGAAFHSNLNAGVGPSLERAFEESFAASDVVSEWRSSGDENAAKVIVLVSTETSAFPLDGESGELTRKMIHAMKLSAPDVFILEWTHAHTPAPLEIMTCLLRASKPVLIFGGGTARSLIGHYPKIGEWSAWEGVRFVATESPLDLLARPELKRVAWAHMQAFMKGLSFG